MADTNNNEQQTQEQPVVTFDDILKDREYQREFDRRVTKAIETAKEKWQTAADKDKADAIADVTAKLAQETVRANVATELVKSGARDVEVVMPLLDFSKIQKDENGLNGLSEQIETLKSSKGYLFEQPEDRKLGKTGLEHGEKSEDDEIAAFRRAAGLT